MSWKNIRDYYRIEHIVRVQDGDILIGSSYVPCLLKISRDGTVSWGNLGPSKNDDLDRYYHEMTADPGRVKELLNVPDVFEQSLPVFTYRGGQIVEKRCERYGWPNVTHDGELMYENTFSPDRAKVVRWAKKNARAWVRSYEERLAELQKAVDETKSKLKAELENIEMLENEAAS